MIDASSAVAVIGKKVRKMTKTMMTTTSGGRPLVVAVVIVVVVVVVVDGCRSSSSSITLSLWKRGEDHRGGEGGEREKDGESCDEIN